MASSNPGASSPSSPSDNMAELRRMASAGQVPTGHGSSLNLDDNQTRWLTVGIAVNKVLVPCLRTFVEDVMKDLYQKLLSINPPFDQQVYNQQHNTWGKVSLEYKNINANHKVRAKPPFPHYNYKVTNHLDLSKLFLQPFMSKFKTFGDTDASALLSLMLNVDDSICSTPQFIQTKSGAKDVKEIRNEWAHCNFQHWTLVPFNKSFQTMNTLLKHIVPGSNQASVIAELEHIRQNGPQLCKDHKVQMEVLQSLSADIGLLASEVIDGKQNVDVLTETLERVQEGFQGWKEIMTDKLAELDTDLNWLFQIVVTEFSQVNTDLIEIKRALEGRWNATISEDDISKYCERLLKYHRNFLTSLLRQMPKLYDVEKYIQLRLCHEEVVNFGENSRLDEYIESAKIKGNEDIKPERLFDEMKSKGQGALKLNEEQVPRTVIIAGVPGGGKTITSYYLLKRMIDKDILQPYAKFQFFIRFRDLNVHKPLSFQSLLLSCHGPSIEEIQINQDLLWDYIVEHQDEMTFILDGYDEFEGLGANFKDENTISFNKMKEAKNPQVLIYNLISGNIMEKAKVILTTRPHCLESLREFAYKVRLVILGNLGTHNIEQMIGKDLKEFPTLCQDVTDYIKQNAAIQSLCSVPINARALLDHIRWVHRDGHQGALVKDKQLAKDTMPRTMAGLLFVLDLKMLQISDRSLPKGKQIAPERIITKRRDFLQRLANLAFSGVSGTIKQRFSEEDIEAFGLAAQDLEESIMTCSDVTLEGAFGPVVERFYSFPHLIQHEHLAGLHLAQRPVEEIEKIPAQDNLLPMYLGVCGDPMVSKYLPHIYPGTHVEEYRCRARRVVRAIWESSVKPMLAIRLWYESQQLEMVPDVIQHLCDHHGALRLPSPTTPADRVALCQFIDSLPRSGFTGVCLPVLHKGDGCVMEALKTLIKEHSTLTSLSRPLWEEEDVLAGWASGDYSNIQCMHLTTDNLDTLCQPLHTCQHLDTLVWWYNMYRCKPSVRSLTSLKDLKHLSFRESGIGELFAHIDGAALCDVVMNGQLSWLHLESTDIGGTLADLLSSCLSNQACKLHTLWLDECQTSLSVYKSLCESLTHNKQIRALGITYTQEGNSLVQAVSHLLEKNDIITELDIHNNGITDISSLCGVLQTKSTLKVLDLSRNKLSTTSMSHLCATLIHNTSLEVLLMNSLSSEHASELTASLVRKTFLKLLSLRDSKVTESCILGLIESTSLEVLDVGYVTVTDVGAIAQALCRSSSLQALGLGHTDKDTQCVSFLNVLCECYPHSGPLQALYIPCLHPSVRRAGADLAERLNIPHLVRHEAGRRDIAGDLGYRWCSLPSDRRWWLLSDL